MFPTSFLLFNAVKIYQWRQSKMIEYYICRFYVRHWSISSLADWSNFCSSKFWLVAFDPRKSQARLSCCERDYSKSGRNKLVRELFLRDEIHARSWRNICFLSLYTPQGITGITAIYHWVLLETNNSWSVLSRSSSKQSPYSKDFLKIIQRNFNILREILLMILAKMKGQIR